MSISFWCHTSLVNCYLNKYISQRRLLACLLTYGFWNEILNSALLITCCKTKTWICSVGRIWVHLLTSQRSLIFAQIIWSSKFGFSSEILKSASLITCCGKKFWVHLFISKQSSIFVSIIWYKIWILQWDWLHGGLVMLHIL